MNTKIEPRVALSEIGLERMTPAELKAYADLADVTVELDYLDRPSISLSAAYRIAEQRRKAEAEWRESEAQRLRDHAKQVEELQRRCDEAFLQARTARLAANIGGFGGQVAIDGSATNEGLQAARAIWSAAPPAVRDEVTSISHETSGMVETIPLHISLPLPLLSDYAAKAARKN